MSNIMTMVIDLADEDLRFKIQKEEDEPDCFLYRLFVYRGTYPIHTAHICLNEDQIITLKWLFEKAKLSNDLDKMIESI